MSAEANSYKFVAIGLGAEMKSLLESLLEKSSVKYVDSFGQFEDFIETFELTADAHILVSDAIAEIAPVELGQALRASFISAKMVFVTSSPEKFSPEDLKKNGFSMAFFMPMDKSFVTEFINTSTAGSVKKNFKAVKLMDLAADEELDFGVFTYMPRNKKFILLTAEGKISEKKYQLLQANLQKTLYVETGQMQKFYDYAAEKLVQLSSPDSSPLSETEREERFKQNIQELFHLILDQQGRSDFKGGRDLMDQSNQVVQRFVELKMGVSLAEYVQNILAPDADSYSHAQAVSTLACLLSMALGIGEPEDLALAGLFHDVGVTGWAEEPDPLQLEKLSPEDQERYKRHPTAAVNLLKAKKMTLPPVVAEIIEKHHERVDGRGYPQQLPAHKIPPAAHLLAFADLFEYLMRPKAEGRSLTPEQAIDWIEREAGLHPDIILKVRRYFEDSLSFSKAS